MLNNPIKIFLEEMEKYQSNHFGYYNRTSLVNAYKNLPSGIKKYITPEQSKLKFLWRGCDGLSEIRAVSFTNNKGIAHLFGAFVIPFKEIKEFYGLIDTEKVRKLNNRLGYKFSVGDDEGEVIVINPVWQSDLESRLRQYLVD